MDNFLTDYIKAIENPNKVGWNGKVWTAPNLKGYDSNQRGYGIDINTNKAAKKLTEGRSGKWLTDLEATNLMNQHINYIDNVAKRKIKGYESFSPKKKAAVLGMLYRGDSVTQNINLDEQDEDRFIDSIYNYYKSKGLNERIKNSQNFFNKNIKSKLTTPPDWSKIIPVWEPPILFKKGGMIRKMLTAAGGPLKAPLVKINGKWTRLQSQGDGNLTAGGRLFQVKTKPTNALGSGNDLVVTPRKKATIQTTPKPTQEYRSAFDSSAIPEFINAMTAGGFNNLSPTQWARRAYDAVDLMKGNMSQKQYINSWINGNNGVVTDKFAEEHPYWSAGINMAGDAAALGGIFGGSKILSRTSKPKINILADSSTSSVSLTPALSLQQIEKAFEEARLWHLNRINSPGYTNRALRAGFTKEEVPQLLQLLTRLINSLRLQNKEKLFPSTFSRDEFVGKINADYWSLPTNKGVFLGIGFYNPNMSYDEAVSKFIHEFGHGATFGLNGNETTGLAGKLSKQFPLITRAVLYNKSLLPKVTEETVGKVFPWAAENGKLGYYSRPTELFARGYEFMRDFSDNWFKLKKSGKPFTNVDALNNAIKSRLNNALFNGFVGNLGTSNFVNNSLGISVPLGLGGYSLYNNGNLLQQLQYLKQGGKVIQQFKNRKK